MRIESTDTFESRFCSLKRNNSIHPGLGHRVNRFRRETQTSSSFVKIRRCGSQGQKGYVVLTSCWSSPGKWLENQLKITVNISKNNIKVGGTTAFYSIKYQVSSVQCLNVLCRHWPAWSQFPVTAGDASLWFTVIHILLWKKYWYIFIQKGMKKFYTT